MKVAVIPNGRAAGVHAALPAVCAQLQALGAQTLCPASGAFPSPGSGRADRGVRRGGRARRRRHHHTYREAGGGV